MLFAGYTGLRYDEGRSRPNPGDPAMPQHQPSFEDALFEASYQLEAAASAHRADLRLAIAQTATAAALVAVACAIRDAAIDAAERV